MNKKNGTKVGFIAAAIALLVVAVAVPAGAGDLEQTNVSGDYGQFCIAYSWAYGRFWMNRKLNPEPWYAYRFDLGYEQRFNPGSHFL